VRRWRERFRADFVSEPEAEAEIVAVTNVLAVVSADHKSDGPEVAREVQRLSHVVNEKSKTATARLRVSLPIVPLLVSSYNLEIDTERALEELWVRLRRLFERAI